ncbi:MAG: glycosyl hydrolase [Polyangiaceae bacterium]
MAIVSSALNAAARRCLFGVMLVMMGCASGTPGSDTPRDGMTRGAMGDDGALSEVDASASNDAPSDAAPEDVSSEPSNDAMLDAPAHPSDAAPEVSAQPIAPPAKSSKIGGAIWAFSGASRALADLHPSFFYTWSPTNAYITAPANVPFVPMIWGAKNMNATDLSGAQAAGTTLLGFNEPDVGGQSNLTVQQALAYWPQLEATGQRLGSPAPGGAGAPTKPSNWLVQFMAGAASAGYRVDFVCLHWYTDSSDPVASTAALKIFLENSYATFGKPIWLTEYAMLSWDGAPPANAQEEAAFASKSTAMMDTLPFVEKYSWYAMSPQGAYSLYNEDGTETEVGMAYKSGP